MQLRSEEPWFLVPAFLVSISSSNSVSAGQGGLLGPRRSFGLSRSKLPGLALYQSDVKRETSFEIHQTRLRLGMYLFLETFHRNIRLPVYRRTIYAFFSSVNLIACRMHCPSERVACARALPHSYPGRKHMLLARPASLQ